MFPNALSLFKNQNSDAGANVVCKVVIEENKFKAVSDTVWVWLNAVIVEKT